MNFIGGKMCFSKDFFNPNKRSWKRAVVEEVLGKIIYLVRILENIMLCGIVEGTFISDDQVSL